MTIHFNSTLALFLLISLSICTACKKASWNGTPAEVAGSYRVNFQITSRDSLCNQTIVSFIDTIRVAYSAAYSSSITVDSIGSVTLMNFSDNKAYYRGGSPIGPSCTFWANGDSIDFIEAVPFCQAGPTTSYAIGAKM